MAFYRNNRFSRRSTSSGPVKITAKFASHCTKCGTDIQVGAKIYWQKGEGAWHENCNPSGDSHADNEYYAGLADGQRYQDEKKVYGAALAERFAAEDEFNRFWKYGEDY